jgi:hypothetical protein
MWDNEWPRMRITDIEWSPFGYDFHGVDYIMGMLLETEEMYMIAPSGQVAFIYIIGRGVVPFRHDFSVLSESEIERMVFLIRRDMTIT